MADVRGIVEQLLSDRDSGALDALCRSVDVDLLVWFGSSRSDPARARDVDVAYSFESGEGDDLAVVNALGERYGDALDIMALEKASVVARYEALCKGETLVNRTPHKFARLQGGAFGVYCDTQWMRDAQLEAMAR